jgi:glycerophosphoryl diester phosphodiesterase
VERTIAVGDTSRVSRIPYFASSPIVIAHRGASGQLPEQTLEAFDLAIEHGADAIELDVIPTRDAVLLARHENELSITTNVADQPSFVSRRTTRVVDGEPMTGCFAEDFTAEEIRTLRARQRFAFRDHSRDDKFMVPTLDEVLEWRKRRSETLGRRIGIFIEIKHPTYFKHNGFDIADILVAGLSRHHASKRDSGIALMSFETRVLRDLRERCELPLIQILDAPDLRPFDWTDSGDTRTYANLISPAGLAEIVTYADGIGPWKRLIVPTLSSDADGGNANLLRLAPPTSLIDDAHATGLFVCSWTFRDEPRFLAADYAGDAKREYKQFYSLGIDGVISDFPKTAHAGRIELGI